MVRALTFACALSCVACGGGGTLTGGGGRGGVGGMSGGDGIVTGIGGITGAAGVGTGGYADWDRFCATEFVPRELPPRVLLALDAGPSMNDGTDALACSGGCGPSSKWAAAVAAINATAVETGDCATWGLELFATEGTETCGTRPGIAVQLLPGSTPALALALQTASSPNGGVAASGLNRQTRGAVDAAIAYMATQSDANPKVIVLMTDGAPSCATGGAPAADDTRATVDAITVARTAGVPTFVIGIATAGGPAHDSMTMMGSAGLAWLDAGGVTSYLPASSVAELRTALAKVVDVMGGCMFEVPPPHEYTSRGNISVKLDGAEIVHDQTHQAGWDYVDSSQMSVRVYGPPCDAVKSAQPGAVTIRFRCLAF